jgi:hypothetical protein
MTRTRRTWAQLAAIAVVATGALIGTGTAAKADPPPGWEPGPDSIEYDFADLGWVHKGFYSGVAGNWHTGWLNVEEDDDGLTGELVDWRCPAGVEPPAPIIGSYTVDTPCKVKRLQVIEYIQYYDVAWFNQTRDRLVLRGDFPLIDELHDPIGTVHIDMYFQATGDPTVTSDTSTGTLDYSESWATATGVGTVDGHGLGGHSTQQSRGRVSFYLESWVPA